MDQEANAMRTRMDEEKTLAMLNEGCDWISRKRDVQEREMINRSGARPNLAEYEEYQPTECMDL